MNEVRYDMFSGEWVAIAGSRNERPSDFDSSSINSTGSFCPFCPGHEYFTPDELFSIAKPSTTSGVEWDLRVIPNKYPIFKPELASVKNEDSVFRSRPGFGHHEVIIESPTHESGLDDFSVSKLSQIIDTYKQRLSVLYSDPGIEYAQVLRNYGQQAGASLLHPHSQVIAIPFVPDRIRSAVTASEKHYNNRGVGLTREIVNSELEAGRRVVFQNEHFVVIEPYWARVPFETWILPLEQESDFRNITRERMDSLAEVLKRVLWALRISLLDVPYNLMLITAPVECGVVSSSVQKSFDWRLEILPRMNHIGGYEWGTGYFVNPVPPEEAADILRDAVPSIGMMSDNWNKIARLLPGRQSARPVKYKTI